MLGKDLLIAMGGRVIAAQRTCNLNMQQDTIEVCSPVSGPWREYIPSTLGWDVSCDGLIYAPEYADELMEVLTRRQKVRLSYYDPELRIVRSGYAIPTGLQQGASISDLANYSLRFQGTGELGKVAYTTLSSEETVTITGVVLMGEIESHYFGNRGLLPQSMDVVVKKYTINTPSRIRCGISRNDLVLLCRAASIDELVEAIDNAHKHPNIGMLDFYAKHEIAHVKSIKDNIEMAVAPGVYYMVCNSNLGSFRALSLPTT